MVEVYTDGAYSSSRNQGGWAFVVVENDIKKDSKFDSVLNTTNNRMEIQAVLEAILYLKRLGINEVTIYSDSMYVIGTMTKNWKKNKNTDLWIKMFEAIDDMTINWEHVKGHNGNKFNDICDMLAVHASQIILNIQ
jgi:ribonuclease HI